MGSAIKQIVISGFLAFLGVVLGDGPVVKTIWAATAFILGGMAVALNEIVTVLRETRRG